MKKTLSLLLMLAMAVNIFSGCHKTPDSPIVIGKDIDNMIDKAAESPVAAAADSGEDLRTLLMAPERLTLTTQGAKGNLVVHIDADVMIPDTASMPVARVGMEQFNENDVETLYNTLNNGAKSVRPDSASLSTYYLEQMQELEQMMVSGNYGDKFGSKEEVEAYIQELQRQAATATDHYEEAEPDFSFKTSQDEQLKHLGPYAQICFTPDDKIISEILVMQDGFYGTGLYAQFIRNKYGDNAGKQAGTPAISQDDAQKVAQDMLVKLGLIDFVCTAKQLSSTDAAYNKMFTFGPSGAENNRSLYEFMFTRTINNVPITYTKDRGDTTVHRSYTEPWMYEQIHIFVDDAGVFFLSWSSPYIVEEIVSDASSMLPFSDIQDILGRMLPIKHDHMDSDERYSYEMNVTEVHLGLMRITEKNVGDSGLLIPVWDFFGTVTMKKEGVTMESDDEFYTFASFITINAIDGSIIDRELGY
jgi:hypothetical protein